MSSKMLNIFLLLFIFGESYGVIYKLNETDYQRMPALFKFDNYEECLSKPEGIYCTTKFEIIKITPNPVYDMIVEFSKHTVKHYNHSKLFYGVCLSDNRNQTNISTWDLKQSVEARLNESFWSEHRLRTKITDISCSNEKEDYKLDIGDVIVGTACLILVLLNVVASFCDLYFGDENNKSPEWYHYFSIRCNWRRLMEPFDETNPRLRPLKCLNGLRSVLMCLVILIHTSVPVFVCNNNPRYLEQWFDNIYYHLLFNATFIMQIFIVISGFLLIYNQQISDESNEISWKILPKRTLERWLRLTPPYAVILALTATWFRHVGSGPFWPEVAGSEIRDCRRYWWQHLLYIHNYSNESDCTIQSWYIAADMQLFIFGLIIYLACRTPRSRKIVLPTFFFIGIAIVAAHTYLENLDGTVICTPEVIRNQIRIDPTFLKVYRRSHTNIPCYILGMGAGYLFYYWQKINLNLDKIKKYKMLCWMLGPLPVVLGSGIMVMASYFYMDAPRSSVMLRTMYAATAKPVFGLLFTVLICAMIMKLENVFRTIFEWDCWSIVARLSYCAYNIHVTIIRYTASLSTVPFQQSIMAMVQYYIFILVVSLLLSIPLWLLVEEPMNRVWKLYLRSSSKTTQVQEKIKLK
ncbi:nose resistant to fluoxetine protein 6 isoform X2 [Bombyx mori]|uniref:Acyltransferase 3 domain-containing protein n=1 Tax=Bombyx mori TaxID=7091 RepID=A0A8R2C5Z6_BOMMO|nr:nose resistant to fluoxetine protein 6 isoform X2 [Bombyx mori]